VPVRCNCRLRPPIDAQPTPGEWHAAHVALLCERMARAGRDAVEVYGEHLCSYPDQWLMNKICEWSSVHTELCHVGQDLQYKVLELRKQSKQCMEQSAPDATSSDQ
jgi:hypothetical protein